MTPQLPAEKQPFLNRNLLLLMQGFLINQIGTEIALVTTTFWVKSTTNSASLLGLITAVTAIPAIILSPIGGVFADRWFRRESLIVCDLLCGCISWGLFFLIGAHLALHQIIAGILLARLFLSSISAFTGPAFNAFIPDLVHPTHLPKAIALSHSSLLIAAICGQALAGLLLTHFAPYVLFGLDGMTYLISVLALSFIRIPAPTPKIQTSGISSNELSRVWDELCDGARYVWHRKGMRLLLLASIPINLFTTPIFLFLPFYTTNSLHEPLSKFGYLLATFSVGMLTGYITAARIRPGYPHIHKLVLGCVMGTGAVAFILSQVHSFQMAIALLFVFGWLGGVVMLLSMNALIARTLPDKRGRLSSVLVMISKFTPLAMSVFGLVGDRLHGDVRPLYMVCAAMLLLIGFTLFFSPDLRRFFEGTDDLSPA